MPNFDKYDGMVRFRFDDQDYAVRFKTEDLKELTNIGLKLKKSGDADLVALKKVHMDMLIRSYPDSPPQKIDAFLDMRLDAYHEMFIITAGLATKEQLELAAKKAQQMTEKAMEDFLDPANPGA